MKSFDLHWLSKIDKDLPSPALALVSSLETSGKYFSPKDDELCFEERYYPLKSGLIVVNTADEIRWPGIIQSILAHEWRHHWQRFNIGPFKPFSYVSQSYDDMVRKHFSCATEADALRFQIRMSDCAANDEWCEILGWPQPRRKKVFLPST